MSKIDRGLVLLNLQLPQLSLEDSARLSLGERDSRLLLLREQIFGKKLLNTVICPACKSKLEWTGNTRDIMLKEPDIDSIVGEYEFMDDDYSIRFRLPNSEDIAEIITQPGQGNHEQLLFEKCIIKGEKSGRVIKPDKIPGTVRDKISLMMKELDPQAEIEINLNCPDCGNTWVSQFDILSYLWSEINYWANSILQEVDILAREYGWSEEQIISLSPMRRQTYLELIGS